MNSPSDSPLPPPPGSPAGQSAIGAPAPAPAYAARVDGAPASVGRRAGAYAIDFGGLLLLVGIPTALLSFFVGMGAGFAGPTNELGAFGVSLGITVVFRLIRIAAALAYFGLMEAFRGQTLGKMALGLRVVGPDGQPPTLKAALLRRLPFFAPYVLPFVGLLGVIAWWVIAPVTASGDKPWHRGLHDRWADTAVVNAT